MGDLMDECDNVITLLCACMLVDRNDCMHYMRLNSQKALIGQLTDTHSAILHLHEINNS